jgi:hypothetical protein
VGALNMARLAVLPDEAIPPPSTVSPAPNKGTPGPTNP